MSKTKEEAGWLIVLGRCHCPNRKNDKCERIDNETGECREDICKLKLRGNKNE